MAHKNSKRGFTLVELLATLAIVSVISALMGGMVYSMTRMYRNIVDMNKAKALAETTMMHIETEVRYAIESRSTPDTGGANKPEFITPANQDKVRWLYSQDGKIMQNDIDLYGDTPALYAGMDFTISWNTVKIPADPADPDSKDVFYLQVTIRAYRGDRCVYTYTGKVAQPNVDKHKLSVTSATPGAGYSDVGSIDTQMYENWVLYYLPSET